MLGRALRIRPERQKSVSTIIRVTECFQSLSSGCQTAFIEHVTSNHVSSLFPSLLQPSSAIFIDGFLNELQQPQLQSPTQFNQINNFISINLMRRTLRFCTVQFAESISDICRN
jgi:hypothetical protein